MKSAKKPRQNYIQYSGRSRKPSRRLRNPSNRIFPVVLVILSVVLLVLIGLLIFKSLDRSNTTPSGISSSAPSNTDSVKVSGILLDSDDAPMANKKIELHSDILTTTTDNRGYYEFLNVMPGDHTLYVKDDTGTELGKLTLKISKGDKTEFTEGELIIEGDVILDLGLTDSTLEVRNAEKEIPQQSDSDTSSQSSSGLSEVTEPTPGASELPDLFTLPFPALAPVSNPKIVQHNELRGLYIGSAANLDANIEIANNSDINAFVIDLKESNGVYFKSKNELANEIGVVYSNYNVETLVRKAKENNIKLIGRIVCFKDYDLAEARPDLCIQDKDGNPIIYPLDGNKPFVNPANTLIWEYLVDIAKEAIELGFDEIQFDYVRFPVCGPDIRKAEYFPGNEGTVFINEDGSYNYENGFKYQCINAFLSYAKREIQDKLGVPLSIDVFGSVMVYRGFKQDGYLIGQEWASLNQLGLDTISPMIYPSHFADGTVMNGKKYADPDQDTYGFLKAVYIESGYATLNHPSHQRPYIQNYAYTAEQVFGQIDALADIGINEYIFWNASGRYDPTKVR
ncbi:MAG: putative glycoside hydrolase [Eubacteriales bacterium]|nr:putative glycoside hydrolase [Eubacteriales bacterium]